MKVHVLHTGSFGSAVADRLGAMLAEAGDTVWAHPADQDPWKHPSSWPHADFRILIAWRESPAVVEELDRVSAETGIAYTQAVMAHPRLRVGPTIVPAPSGGGAGCARCHEKRRKQHGAITDRTQPLFDLYNLDPSQGPAGYLPHHVSLAAHRLAAIAGAIRDRRVETVRNQETTFHLLNNALTSATLVPVHGCQRCSNGDAEASWSEIAELFMEKEAHRG